MPIEALPPATVRSIGSTQCLTDPSSLVKELLDNAIDAKATSIFIEISTNTLDKIQVKDNGQGITPEDRGLLCRRSCTSKIRDLNDLHNIGGRSLGFRGEALASAVEISGSVVITTRVDGEPTATEVIYTAKGGNNDEKLVSHPVGTSVMVKDFLASIPVRKQNALKQKSCAVQLSKMKRMLQAYVLAKPHLRISFRVIKAKNEKGNWVYAPGRPKSSRTEVIQDAAVKIFGNRSVEQCRFVSWKSTSDKLSAGVELIAREATENVGEAAFEFQALAPTITCESDFNSIDKPHQLVSIDGRPVSCTRETLKQVVSYFKKCFKSARLAAGLDQLADPVLCLNIVCPMGSYDANIEPAKDDVLFEAPDRLLKAAESFFHLIYGEPAAPAPKEPLHRQAKNLGNFDLLLASRSASPAKMNRTLPQLGQAGQDEIHVNGRHGRPGVDNAGEEATEIDLLPEYVRHDPSLSYVEGSNKARKAMYNDDEDDLSETESPERCRLESADIDEDASHSAMNDISVSNPGAIAKFNAVVRKPTNTSSTPNGLPTPERQRGDILTSPLSRAEVEPHLIDSAGRVQSSPPPFPFPQQQRGRGRSHHVSNPVNGDQLDTEVDRHGSLDDWVRNVPQTDFISARAVPIGTPLSAIPNASQRPRQRPRHPKANGDALKKPFVSPVNDLRDVWGFPTADRSRRASNKNQAVAKSHHTSDIAALNLREEDETTILAPSSSSIVSPAPIHPDLAETMHYEARKAIAMQNYKSKEKERRRLLEQSLPSRRRGSQANIRDDEPIMLTPPSSSPHHNRFLKARAALQPAGNAEAATSPQADNARALLMQVQDNNNETAYTEHNSRSKRARTALLPLEHVQENDYIHTLQLRLPTSLASITDIINSNETNQMGFIDKYISRGEDSIGLNPKNIGDYCIWAWERRLETLLIGKLGALHEVESLGRTIEFDWSSVLTDRELNAGTLGSPES